MFQTLLVASLAVSAVAFRPASSSSRVHVSKLSMSAEFLPGALAPLGKCISINKIVYTYSH